MWMISVQAQYSHLFSGLKVIEDQLVPLSDKSVPLQILDNVQDGEDVNGLLEDLQEAVRNYMVCLQL